MWVNKEQQTNMRSHTPHTTTHSAAPGDKPADADATAPAPEEEEKEEAPTKTLEDYEKEVAAKRAALNKAAAPPAKVDGAALEGLATFKRVNVEETVDLVKLEKGIKKKAAAAAAAAGAPAAKVQVETGFRVSDGSAPRGDGGGRGRGRGGGRGGRGEGRGRGGGRGEDRSFDRAPSAARVASGPAPPIDDASAFPTLGGK